MAKYDFTNLTPFNEQPLYKQGFEDAIDRACEWLKNNCGHYDGTTFSLHNVSWGNQTEFLAEFRKAMEE